MTHATLPRLKVPGRSIATIFYHIGGSAAILRVGLWNLSAEFLISWNGETASFAEVCSGLTSVIGSFSYIPRKRCTPPRSSDQSTILRWRIKRPTARFVTTPSCTRRKRLDNLRTLVARLSGTGLYGRLPQYIYSISDDGLFVNLYEPSTISWQHRGQDILLRTATTFPDDPDVALTLTTEGAVPMKIRLRIPRWARNTVPILINNNVIAEGKPGTFTSLDRVWADGDRISFTLPIDFRLTKYEGFDQIDGWDRYALEYGPVLLALGGPFRTTVCGADPMDRRARDCNSRRCNCWTVSNRCPGPQLRFRVRGQTDYEYLPYMDVSTETFTCLPIVNG